jgi:putative ABC transport system substrate-binding protein
MSISSWSGSGGRIRGRPAWAIAAGFAGRDGARAQQAARPVIRFLAAVSPDGFTDRLRAFRDGLKQTGFGEGENLAIEYRWAENQLDRLPALAADLVGRRAAVIICIGSNNLPAVVQAATMTIPIVFGVSEDPVRLRAS